MRLPRTAEQQASKLIDGLSPRSRFIIPYVLLSLLTPLLVSPDIFSLFSYSVPEGVLHFIGLSLVAAIIYFALLQAAGRMQTGTVKPRSAFWIASLAILGQAAVIRFGLAVVTVLSGNHEARRFGDSFADQFAIPFAACALVLSLLLGSQMALIAALIVALFTGLMMMNSSGMVIALYALTSSIIAIYRVERYRTRNTITKAILGIGLVNVVMSLAILLIANRALTWHLAFESVFMGLLGALITAGIASVVTPVY